jgi:glycosyltransferase involved in cell wall biosynthesis
MPETARSFSQVESPAPGATLPAGRHVIRGWVWPKTGGHFADVRARVDGCVFPGVHGLPRADIAAHFSTGRPVALAEFLVVVALPPGDIEITLEALTIEGTWTAFQTLSLAVTPANPAVDFAVPGGPLRWIDYGHGLRRLLHAVGASPNQPVTELAAQLADELPFPRVLRDAPAPFHGFVDEPASVCWCHFGRIPAFGHLFHPQLQTRRILATVDLQSWQPLAIHQPSPGPAAHYTQFTHAGACGFTGLVDVPAQLPNPVSLRIYAELEDGSMHLGPVVRARLHQDEDEKFVPTTTPSIPFETLSAAWDRALQDRNIPVTRDGELATYLGGLRASYESALRQRPLQSGAPLIAPPSSANEPVPRRVLLATHGLDLQGAPRFLLDLARTLAAAGAKVEVISATDGPLRSAFADLGADITIIDAGPMFQASSTEDLDRAITGLGRMADWSAVDLVVANSFTTFWAVHAANRASRPALLYVHESTTPATFYGGRVSPAVIAAAEQAFFLAAAVSFTSGSTRRYHLGYGRPERHHLTPGWIDVAALDQWMGTQDREAIRRQLGVQPGQQLVCNIGTISDRKGQHTFARAVDLFQRRYPDVAKSVRFILLGGRQSPFDSMLQESLAELRCENLIVHPETTDYLRYYLAADLFVCSSYEESSPRVVLEAMACRAPILASAVHGVPELVRDGLEACLVPAGDTAAWGESLARLLAAPSIGGELAARARAPVVV